VQQESRGDSCGQSRRRQKRYSTHTTVGPQVECNRTVEGIALDREGKRQRKYSTLTTVGPQFECNRTVKEIAADRAGEEAEEILNTYNCWSSG